MTLSHADLTTVLGFPLAEEQWLAVSSGLEPAVIVAGAGSGKTTSMAARVAYLVGSGHARPDEILGLTFTTKAAAQLLNSMRGPLAALEREGLLPDSDVDAPPGESPDESFSDSFGEPQVLTYHAFSARILSEHGIRLGIEPGATLLTDGLRQQFAYRLVCRTALPVGPLGAGPVTLTGDLLALDDELTELAVSPARLRDFDTALVSQLQGHGPLQVIGEQMRQAAHRRLLLASLVDEWRTEKVHRGYLDFADQIRLAGEIVERFPDVVADLRARYRFVLLDEYQDTSIAQRLLLQRSFGAGHSVMAVGDPCQAIYGWRGASVDNIESFTRHFADGPIGAGGTRYSLTETRRCGPSILEVANRTSQRLRGVHAGVGRLSPSPSTDKGAGTVACALFDTYDAETAWLVNEVKLTQAGGVPWQDTAILCATGRDVARVDAALRRQGIPTQVLGSAALLEQPAVIEARAMLALVHDPTANPEFVRVATGPRWRISPRDLAALGERAAHLAGGRHRSGQESLATALDDAVAGSDVVESVALTEALDDLGQLDRYSPEAVERFRSMADELRRLRRHVGEPVADLVLRVIRETGLEVEVALGPPELARQQVHALAALVDLAAEFTELDGRHTLGAFLARLRDAQRFDVDLGLDVTGPADAVRLLTIHKAKGLEFGYVFVPFVTDRGFPGGRSRPVWTTSARAVPWPLREDATAPLASFPIPGQAPRAKDHDAYLDVLHAAAELDEDRLAYVAFTRAEYGLTVSGHWWGPSQATRRGPGTFLLDVHEACLDGFGRVEHWAKAPPDGATNPQLGASAEPVEWPASPSPEYLASVAEAAQEVNDVVALQPSLPGVAGSDSAPDAVTAVVAEWDLLVGALLEEAHADHVLERTVPLPDAVSASLLMRALKQPEAVAQELLRPMPRPPAPAARRGTELHAWIETRYGQQSLLDPDDLPGAADAEIVSDEALAELKAAFEHSEFAHRSPVAVEAPFAVVVDGRVVNGRIDAVFENDRGGYDVIDWKTGSARNVDPVQLALYRLAWAQLRGVPVDDVDAAFVMVATGEVIRPDTSAELARLNPRRP